MKKINKPKLFKSSNKAPKKHERITNETVAEHREKILAGGRKFKYPVQYAQHRLVINTILVSLLALILVVGIAWWQLYPSQNTDSFFYRLTQLLPLPVASVDNQPVPYRDYLMQYRSSIHWLESKSRTGLFSINSEDGKRQADHFKRQSLNRAIENAYAQKLADRNKLTVSESEIDAFIAKTLQESSKNQHKTSEDAYRSVLSDSLGVSTDEYRLIVKQALLKQKVSFLIDKPAQEKINAAHVGLIEGMPFENVVTSYSDDSFAKTTKGDIGFVPRSNQDQGLVQAALKLKNGENSGIIKGLDGYYIVKLIETKEDQVHYARIKVSLTVFNKQLSMLKKKGKVQEFIKVNAK